MSDNSKFAIGSGIYTCICCNERTRETGSGEADLDLCLACYDEAGLENEHQDGRHDDTPDPNCPYCK